MRLWNWLKGSFSSRIKAKGLYRRGMLRARAHDHLRAIADCDAVIEMSQGLPDMKAMALYNRALIYAASGDEAQALRDLRDVIAEDASPSNVKAAARQKLVRMSRHAGSEGV